MATKYNLVFADGSSTVYAKKQTAIKNGEEGNMPFQVWTIPGGKIVHDAASDVDNEIAPTEEAPAEPKQPAEDVFYEFLDFPGNYSMVMAPFAVEIAEAAGVPTKVETTKGKLTRRVLFGGPNMDLTARTVSLIQEEAKAAHEHLAEWQKETREQRRGLTDMQKFIQHREVLAEHGHKVARQVKKHGV